MRKKRIVYLSIFLLGLSFWAGSLGAAERQSVPAFHLTSLEGKTFTEKEMIGKATLVVFWASWCGTCQKELPKIHQLQKELSDRPFQVIAIGFSDTQQNIEGYVKKHPDTFSFPVFYDQGDQVAGRFGAMATPTLFLFDQEGKLVVPYRGGGLLEHPEFYKTLEKLL